jgi:hypothetical protein
MSNWSTQNEYLWQHAFRAVIDTGCAVIEIILEISDWFDGDYMFVQPKKKWKWFLSVFLSVRG